MHSTNYKNLFIEVAEDSSVKSGEVPPDNRETKTVALLEYELLIDNPYQYTSDDVIFMVYATRHQIPKKSQKAEREKYFLKGRPCFRASPLTKKYGWGVHNDENGKIALHGVGSKEYKQLMSDKSVLKKKAMRSKRT